jgi:hypothetical protein
MKKWMNYVMVIGLTAGTASAAWWPFGRDKNEEQAAPSAAAPEMQRMHRPAGPGDRQRPQMSPEQMEKMRAQHEAIRSLGEAARNETDPAKKEELVGQLRTKLTEISGNMQAEGLKRLEKAEQDILRLKERMEEFDANKSARIEEQIQRILSGEPLRGPDGERPQGAGFRREGKKSPKAPDAE